MIAIYSPTSAAHQRGGPKGSGLLSRFGLVGMATTFLDLALFNLSGGHWSGLPNVSAHLMASVVTLTISFFGQRNIVFRRQGEGPGRQAMRFILVTVVGVNLVQSFVLAGTGGCGSWRATRWVFWPGCPPIGGLGSSGTWPKPPRWPSASLGTSFGSGTGYSARNDRRLKAPRAGRCCHSERGSRRRTQRRIRRRHGLRPTSRTARAWCASRCARSGRWLG